MAMTAHSCTRQERQPTFHEFSVGRPADGSGTGQGIDKVLAGVCPWARQWYLHSKGAIKRECACKQLCGSANSSNAVCDGWSKMATRNMGICMVYWQDKSTH
jgi:hypothetical protein